MLDLVASPEHPEVDLGGNAATVLGAVVRVYGDLQHALAGEQAEALREQKRLGEGIGPGERQQLELELARRQALIQYIGKAIFDGYGSDGNINPTPR